MDNCGYSPATFYRNFKDKYDLIAWDHTRGVAAIMDRIDQITYTWNQTLLDGANWFLQEKDYLVNLFQHTKGQDSFVRYMTEINFAALKKQILLSDKTAELTAKEELLARIYCLGTVHLTCEWLLGMHDASPEDIAQLYEESLPAPLQRFLM